MREKSANLISVPMMQAENFYLNMKQTTPLPTNNSFLST